jgi:hypothetical protein
MSPMRFRVRHRAASLPTRMAIAAAALIACSNGAAPRTTPARSYRLGFSALPPRLTTESVLGTIDAWRSHADVALMSLTPPWKAMLADTNAALLVRRDVAQLAGLYRSHGLPIIVEIDATDGLARDREAPELVALGRSITEPAVQGVYREYLLAVDSIVHPEYLGLAMETNLIRAIAPQTVSAALRVMVNDGAAALAAQHSTAKRFISVQVETAWGRLPSTGSFVGIDADRADFPFIEAIGLSSYPYLAGFAQPEDVPLDYYSRLIAPGSAALPMLVVEGGWSSASAGTITSSPDEQARYIRRQMAIADSAHLVAVTQITFTDLDVGSLSLPPGSILPLFASNGLVDVDLHPKPALAEWDRALARPLRTP